MSRLHGGVSVFPMPSKKKTTHLSMPMGSMLAEEEAPARWRSRVTMASWPVGALSGMTRRRALARLLAWRLAK